MGTTKQLPAPQEYTDSSQKYSIIPLVERIYIPETNIRKQLQQFADTGLTISEYNELIDFLNFKFSGYIRYSTEACGSLQIVNPNYSSVADVIRLLSLSQSLCAIFRLSVISNSERKILADLALHKSVNLSCLEKIYLKIHPLKILLNSLPATLNNDNFLVHKHVAELLFSILIKIQALVRKTTRKVVEKYQTEQDFLNFFPSFSTNYLVPTYINDSSETTSKCTKLNPRHKRFSPGMLVMVCKHKYCYGFEILSSRESTLLVYNMLLRNFKIPPQVIIYDNACNLHTTCIMRDPQLFRNTTLHYNYITYILLVDRFHSRNHVCEPIFSMDTFQTNDMNKVNSQICEQLFSTLRRISTQIAYMRIKNIYFTRVIF